ncbi:hypothetical protein [Stieleria mannarensis]|uniref:hypothetical protein n=1 Tax=Stieleria mannarensis TaxID=2755585 RepID=UPI001601517A|nr:hypothetical protein [Rhodopirellula sp. JC639]
MPHNILPIGEILGDVFLDGPRFGGAPANLGCISAELGQEIVSDDSVCELPGTPVKVIDTVGDGIAFTASMTLGLLMGHNLETINTRSPQPLTFALSL